MENVSNADGVSIAEAKSSALRRAALFLEQAKSMRGDKEEMVIALDNNLQLWVAIRTIARLPEYNLPDVTKENLIRLSHFVAELTFKHGLAIPDEALDTMININLQLSEGLLESINKAHLDAES